jgi:hypothetical protein
MNPGSPNTTFSIFEQRGSDECPNAPKATDHRPIRPANNRRLIPVRQKLMSREEYREAAGAALPYRTGTTPDDKPP